MGGSKTESKDDDGYSEHIVEEKEREGNRFFYGLSDCASWYPRERLALTEKEAMKAFTD